MSQNELSEPQKAAITYGLLALYNYGWGSETCYDELAKLSGELPEEHKGRYTDTLHMLKTNYTLDQISALLVENTAPSQKAGFFEINDKLANPLDGHSLIALENVYRTHLDLSGKLADMSYSIEQVLTTENAQAFFQDWVNAKEGMPVTIRGIGNDFPVYFTPSDERGVLPEINASAMQESLMEIYPDITESQASFFIDDLCDFLETPKNHIENTLTARQNWDLVSGMAKPSNTGSSLNA